MSGSRSWVLAIAAVLAIGALPLLGDRLRSRSEHCALDRASVSPAYAVRIVDDSGTKRSFCGVSCANGWLAAQARAPREISVTDCATGRAFDARAATFVRSLGGWGEDTPDRIRVFADRAEAERHIAAYGGTLLEGVARPLPERKSP